MLINVKYFAFFCNRVNILNAGPGAAATKVNIQIRGLPPLGKATALTALEKLLSSIIPGKRECCGDGLFGNEEYEICRRENSP